MSGCPPNTPKGALAWYLGHMKNNTTQTTQFRSGFKAEAYWGDEITAHHMNTRSVYSFKANSNVSITHDAPYVNDVSEDRFTVSVRTAHTDRHSTTASVGCFNNWLDAYYNALQQIRLLAN